MEKATRSTAERKPTATRPAPSAAKSKPAPSRHPSVSGTGSKRQTPIGTTGSSRAGVSRSSNSPTRPRRSPSSASRAQPAAGTSPGSRSRGTSTSAVEERRDHVRGLLREAAASVGRAQVGAASTAGETKVPLDSPAPDSPAPAPAPTFSGASTPTSSGVAQPTAWTGSVRSTSTTPPEPHRSTATNVAPPAWPGMTQRVHTTRDRRRTAALVGVILGALAFAALVFWLLGVVLPGDDQTVDTAPRVPAAPEEQALDRLFAPIPGFTLEDPPPSDMAEVRTELQRQVEASFEELPGIDATADEIVTGYAGRVVLDDGEEVAAVLAAQLDQQWAPLVPQEDYLSTSAALLRSSERVTVGGESAVVGDVPDDDGVMLTSYTNGIFLVVYAEDRAVARRVAAGVLANMP